MTKPITIAQLAEHTRDALNFDKYGQSGWRGCIRVLRRAHLDFDGVEKLTDRQIKAFLYSKHMRFAADVDNKRKHGKHNGATLTEYLKDNAKYSRFVLLPDQIQDLEVRTYGKRAN